VLDLSNFRIWTRRSFASYTSLRWVTAVLVIVLWSIGQAIDFVPKGRSAPNIFTDTSFLVCWPAWSCSCGCPAGMDRDYAVGRRVSAR
jgi:hypothetical protein